MADQKYLKIFKHNIGVVADRLRKNSPTNFREVCEDEEMRNIQDDKKKDAQLYVKANIMSSNLNTSLGTCSDFELLFMKRKMTGWIKIYNKINPIALSKTIKCEQECLKKVEDEILIRKNKQK